MKHQCNCKYAILIWGYVTSRLIKFTIRNQHFLNMIYITPMLLNTIVKYLSNNVSRFVGRLLQNSSIQVTYHFVRLAYRLEKEARKCIPPSTKDRTAGLRSDSLPECSRCIRVREKLTWDKKRGRAPRWEIGTQPSVGIRVFYVRKNFIVFIFCARLKIIKNSIFNFHDFIAFK